MKFIISFLFFTLTIFAKEKVILNYWTPFTGGDARPMQFIVDKFNNSQNDILVNMKVIKWDKYYDEISKVNIDI